MNTQCGGGAEAARQAHNLEVGGASPSHATNSQITQSALVRLARPPALGTQFGARFNPERKHTRSKPGTADGQAIVRRSTTGAGVRVGQTPPCLRDSAERRAPNSLLSIAPDLGQGDWATAGQSVVPFFVRRFPRLGRGRCRVRAPGFFQFQFERVRRISRLIGRAWAGLVRALPTYFSQYAEHVKF